MINLFVDTTSDKIRFAIINLESEILEKIDLHEFCFSNGKFYFGSPDGKSKIFASFHLKLMKNIDEELKIVFLELLVDKIGEIKNSYKCDKIFIILKEDFPENYLSKFRKHAGIVGLHGLFFLREPIIEKFDCFYDYSESNENKNTDTQDFRVLKFNSSIKNFVKGSNIPIVINYPVEIGLKVRGQFLPLINTSSTLPQTKYFSFSIEQNFQFRDERDIILLCRTQQKKMYQIHRIKIPRELGNQFHRFTLKLEFLHSYNGTATLYEKTNILCASEMQIPFLIYSL
ncbi:MAG: hypothetical protein NTX65_14885 [Ignavibacteriales bacterium]|nr:hypothetical protein [Ignavibacteriales bacterium]